MKRLFWMIIAAAAMAVLLGTGCLIADGHGDAEACCYQYEVCENYCDPYGNCNRHCVMQENCPSDCEAPGGGSETACYSDVDCSGEEICVDQSCRRPDTEQRGHAGLCQACQRNNDCAEAGALCVELQNDNGPNERICTTSCNGGCPNGFECQGIDGSSQCLPTADANGDRTCADAPDLECVAASDCAQGERCIDNRCEPPADAECTADNDCSGAQICDRHQCIDDPTSECTTRSDCRSSEHCVEGTCQRPVDNCVFSEECGDDGMCVNGTCFPTCGDDSDCTRYEHCRQGLCQPTECASTSDCAGDEICVDALCETACDTQTCADGYVCGSQDYCERDPNVECRTNAECSRDQICVEGSCESPCTCNQDCEAGNVCDLESGTCYDPGNDAPDTCEHTCDCASGFQCDSNGQCVSD